jgi:hypothetical protein
MKNNNFADELRKLTAYHKTHVGEAEAAKLDRMYGGIKVALNKIAQIDGKDNTIMDVEDERMIEKLRNDGLTVHCYIDAYPYRCSISWRNDCEK